MTERKAIIDFLKWAAETENYNSLRFKDYEEMADTYFKKRGSEAKNISSNLPVSGNEGHPEKINESPEVAVCWNCGKRLNYTIHGKTYSHCECGAAQ